MKSTFQRLIILLFSLSIFGCGLKGKLYLPDQKITTHSKNNPHSASEIDAST